MILALTDATICHRPLLHAICLAGGNLQGISMSCQRVKPVNVINITGYILKQGRNGSELAVNKLKQLSKK